MLHSPMSRDKNTLRELVGPRDDRFSCKEQDSAPRPTGGIYSPTGLSAHRYTQVLNRGWRGVVAQTLSARRKKYPQSRKPLLEGASSQPLISTATPGSTAPVSVGDKRFGHFLAFAVVPVAVYIYSLFMRPNISTVLSNETGSPSHSYTVHTLEKDTILL